MSKKGFIKIQLGNCLNLIVKFRLAILTLFFVGIITDVFFFPIASDIRLLLLILFWIFIIKIYNFNSTATFKVSLVYLGLLFILFIFFRNNPSLERVSTWIYLFLSIGLVQQFKEIRAK